MNFWPCCFSQLKCRAVIAFTTLYTPPKPAWHWRSPLSPQLRGRPSPKATAPTRPALFSVGCGPGMRSCQSAGSTVVTSPRASAYDHPVNATTAAARPAEFTLKGNNKGGVNRGDTCLGWFRPSRVWKRKIKRRLISSGNYTGHGNEDTVVNKHQHGNASRSLTKNGSSRILWRDLHRTVKELSTNSLWLSFQRS